MTVKIRMRRRVTSGNIKDPELHQERVNDVQARRQAAWTVTLFVAGVVAFLAITAAL